MSWFPLWFPSFGRTLHADTLLAATVWEFNQEFSIMVYSFGILNFRPWGAADQVIVFEHKWQQSQFAFSVFSPWSCWGHWCNSCIIIPLKCGFSISCFISIQPALERYAALQAKQLETRLAAISQNICCCCYSTSMLVDQTAAITIPCSVLSHHGSSIN